MENYEKYLATLNNIIAADDLYWCEEENKYIALSEEEVKQVLQNFIINNKNQGDAVSEAMKVVQWATCARVGTILLKNFLENKVLISVDEEGEICFSKNPNI